MKQNINEKKVKVPFYKTKVFGDRTFVLGMTIFALVDFFLFFVYLNIDTMFDKYIFLCELSSVYYMYMVSCYIAAGLHVFIPTAKVRMQS